MAACSTTSAFCDGVYILATRGFNVRRFVGFASVGGVVSGVGAGDGVSVGAPPPRVTPAVDAHLLTQLCGIPCSFEAALTPFVRTVATTACRCSPV